MLMLNMSQSMPSAQRITLTVSVAVAVAVAVCLLPQRLGAQEPAAGDSSRNRDIAAEFAGIAERLERSTNAFLGRGQVAPLEAAIADPRLPFPRRAASRLQLSHHFLRWGMLAEAEATLEPLLDPDARIPDHYRADVLFAAALVQLRAAERANCIERPHRQCCIFPLAGGGIHAVKEPVREARGNLQTLLALQPDRLDAQWLLNIAVMAAGDDPVNVPSQFRLPPESVAPVEGDTEHWPDVSGALGLDAFDLCGGVIVADFDADGFLDIVTCTSDPSGSMKFFRNDGHGSFADAAPGSGLDVQKGGLNCLGADWDNDGDTDILVLRGAWLGMDGRIRNSLLRNNGRQPDGSVTFTDITLRSGLGDRRYPSQTAVWGDFDNDGDLDLFVGNESRVAVDPSEDFPCQLFRNNGDGTFSDVATVAGVRNDRFTKGVTAGDYDNDGDLDIFVSNAGECRLFRNDGDLRFTDVADDAGVTGGHPYNFACWFFDCDNDGWLDLFVAGYHAELGDFMRDARGQPHGAAPSRLFHNNGDGTFSDTGRQAGLDRAWLPMGANFGDVDNDGWLDVYLATGDPRYEMLVPNILLRNHGGARFANVTWNLGLGHLQKGHGVAFADLDHDGDQDLYNQLGGFYPDDKFRNACFLNPGHPGNGYLSVELIGTRSNRDAIGARLTLELTLPGGGIRKIHRAVGSVSSFGGSPLNRQEIGIGDASAVHRLVVRWPGGESETFTGIPRNTAVTIREGDGQHQSHRRKRLHFAP